MTALWVLAFIYAFAAVINGFYVQPLRRRWATESGIEYEPGALSFGINAALPIFLGLLLVRTFIVDVYHVPSESMFPHLEKGTRIFVNRLAYGVRSPLSSRQVIPGPDPRPGEVFVFRYPREPRTVYVKRVLAISGDRVRVSADGIVVNGDPVLSLTGVTDEFLGTILGGAEVVFRDDPTIDRSYSLDLTVPEGHFFAIGDNLDHSEDSRTWGFVAKRHLIGRVIR